MEIEFRIGEIDLAARKVLGGLGKRNIVALHGEMGAGKTTLVTAMMKELGIKEAVSSPTFSIINEYKGRDVEIYHIDLYRLKDAEEAVMAGVEACLISGNLCFIEWPEIGAKLLPPEALHCYLTTTGEDQRKLRINL